MNKISSLIWIGSHSNLDSKIRQLVITVFSYECFEMYEFSTRVVEGKRYNLALEPSVMWWDGGILPEMHLRGIKTWSWVRKVYS